MKIAAKFFSVLFHPILLPFYVLPFYFSIENYQNEIIRQLNSGFIYAIYSIMLIIGVLFPLMSIYIMYRTGIISSINLPDRKERIPVFIIVIIYYVMAYIMYRSWNLSYYHIIDPLLSFLAGGIALAILTFIISLFWKISLHSTSISGVAGGFLAFAWTMTPIINSNMLLLLNVVLLILMGLVSSSRLILKAHQPLEIYAGMILGFSVEYFIVVNGFTF